MLSQGKIDILKKSQGKSKTYTKNLYHRGLEDAFGMTVMSTLFFSLWRLCTICYYIRFWICLVREC